MKIRLIAIAGLVIGFAMTAFAQQTNTPDPQLRQQLEAFAKKEDEAFNNNDAAAVAALFMEDAVMVTNRGPIYGREAIEKHLEDLTRLVFGAATGIWNSCLEGKGLPDWVIVTRARIWLHPSFGGSWRQARWYMSGRETRVSTEARNSA